MMHSSSQRAFQKVPKGPREIENEFDRKLERELEKNLRKLRKI